jgi:hypothetical protein
LIEVTQCPQIEVERGEIAGRPLGRARGLCCLQFRLDNAGDAGGYFVLEVEHVFEEAVEAVGPEMRAGTCVDQLRGDTHATPRFAHRAFEDIAHTQLAADLVDVEWLGFVCKARIAGDDEEPPDPREGGNDLLDDAVCEVFLLGIAAHVLEWHHRQRGLVRQRQPLARLYHRGSRHARYRRGEAIAAASDGLNATTFQSPVIKEPAERRDLYVQIVVLDHRRRPDRSNDLVPRDEFPCPPDQHAEKVKRARADRQRHEKTALVAPEQAAPVEKEAFELETIVHGERVPACASTPSKILGQFITFYPRFVARFPSSKFDCALGPAG